MARLTFVAAVPLALLAADVRAQIVLRTGDGASLAKGSMRDFTHNSSMATTLVGTGHAWDGLPGSSNVAPFIPAFTTVVSGEPLEPSDATATVVFSAIYAGASCRGNAGLSYTSGANVLNVGAQATTLICPTRRVSDPSGNMSNTVFGEAFVVDRNAKEDVCCQVFGRTPNGNMQAGAIICSSGAKADHQRLRMDLPKVKQPYTFAHYSMKCTLPAASRGAASSILSYSMIQQRQ